MRSSDLFYGLLAAMAIFGAVVAFAAGVSGAVSLVMLFVAVLAAVAMMASAEAAPQALVVGRRDGHLNLLESELDTGGFAVASCPGPASRPCPVLQGRPCPVPARPRVTIAYLDGPEEALPPCERHFHVPTVSIDGGPAVERSGAARQLRWEDGTRAAVEAIRELTHV